MTSLSSNLFSPVSILERQRRAGQALASTLSQLGLSESSLILVLSGDPIQKPGGLDQTYPFLPHPEYYWLSGSRRSGEVMSFISNGSQGGDWIRWYRPVSAVEKLWEGEPDIGLPASGVESKGNKYQEIDGLKNWLIQNKPARIFVFGNLSSLAAVLPATLVHKVVGTGPTDANFLSHLQYAFDSQRRIKDVQEIALLKRTAAATAAGFKVASNLIAPGITEREIQIAIETEMFKHGAMGTGYGTLVGTGARSAVLHCEPGSYVVQKNEYVLIDAGAEIGEYTSDVTRTFYSAPKMLPKHQAIYDCVLESQKAGIARCKVGIEWSEVHRTSAQVIAQGLKDFGLFNCSASEAVESGAVGLFFPHGVGHLVGLRVRDVGGRALNRMEGMTAGARLRVDLPLEAGFVVTVEPGIYFVDAILNDPIKREQFKSQVAWSKVSEWQGMGGVRIEDDIHITASEPEILTAAIPK